MGLATEVRVLAALARGMPRAGSHAARLERFYGPQAHAYDAFRDRLLHGREELLRLLDPLPGARLVELGGGTGRAAELLGDRLPTLASLEIVDLCGALLAVARERHARNANVRCVAADATTYRPAAPVDCVYFCYSLSMIPDWRAALDNAVAMLAPGGSLGVVDFHVSPGQHGALTRGFWTRWFAHDGVRPSPEHAAHLAARLDTVACLHRRGPVPYLPGLAAPYWVYLGRKRVARSAA
jgi:S-adenosylmethionine-diacylgycerolhomoserine-N-methlytransferase